MARPAERSLSLSPWLAGRLLAAATVLEGSPTPYLERHPYWRNQHPLEGGGVSIIEHEQVRRGVGELLLLGPGLHHWE